MIRWRNSHQNRNDCLEELYQALEEAERFDILKSLQEEAKTTDLLDDKNLQNMVAKKLGKEWREVMINLGLGSSEIEQIETENESHVVTLITKGLMIWRDRNSRNKSDRQHLMELYKALQDAGRSDIVGDLKQEFNTDGAFQDPEPMSDIHLLLLIENCTDEELFSVWTLLDISEGEIDTICKDPLSTNQQHQLLNMLITARENAGNTSDAFRKFVDALKHEGLVETYDWVIRSCKRWLKKCEDMEGPLKQTVEDYISEVEGHPAEEE